MSGLRFVSKPPTGQISLLSQVFWKTFRGRRKRHVSTGVLANHRLDRVRDSPGLEHWPISPPTPRGIVWVGAADRDHGWRPVAISMRFRMLQLPTNALSIAGGSSRGLITVTIYPLKLNNDLNADSFTKLVTS